MTTIIEADPSISYLNIPNEGTRFGTMGKALEYIAGTKINTPNTSSSSNDPFYINHNVFRFKTISTPGSTHLNPFTDPLAPGTYSSPISSELDSAEIAFFKEGQNQWDYVSEVPDRRFILEQWPTDEKENKSDVRDGNSIGLKRHIFLMYKRDSRKNLYTYVGEYRITALFPVASEEARKAGIGPQLTLWEHQ